MRCSTYSLYPCARSAKTSSRPPAIFSSPRINPSVGCIFKSCDESFTLSAMVISARQSIVAARGFTKRDINVPGRKSTMAFWDDDFIVLVFPARATTTVTVRCVERRRRCPCRCLRCPAASRNVTRDDSVVVVVVMGASKSEASLYYDARLCVVVAVAAVAAVVVRGARQRSPRRSFASSARARASRATVLVVVVVSVLWRGFECQAARETSLAVRARRAG